jgi:dienelactone hydrolase
MRVRAIFIAFVASLAASTSMTTSAQTIRWEIHPIHTQTLSDHQFLTGAKDGQPTLIAGELRLPVGTGPFPAVILIHGSGGVGGNVNYWADVFNRMGVAAFIVDSFTGRGITSTIPDQSQIGHLAMIYDAYRALEILGKHPHIDRSWIALMGFSKGGFVALYASMLRFQRYYAPSDVSFAAYIPFYPRCDIVFAQDEEIADKPIRIFHGEADDWIPYEPVKKYAARLRAAGKDVQVTTYPGARHAFDSPTYPSVWRFADAEVSTSCRLVEKDGYIWNLDTGKAFTHQDACITRGASAGSNPEATKLATAAVTGFLRGVFGISNVRP